jgi:transcriptional regulator NrdR family protein
MPRPAIAECPDCQSSMLVMNTRPFEEGKRMRRYECRKCDSRITTYEITAAEYERLQSVKINLGAIRGAIAALQVVEGAVNGTS